MNRRVAMVVVLVALLAGCSRRDKLYPKPTRVLFDASTGAWSVECEGVARAEDLPEHVPGFTRDEGKLVEGLFAPEGSRAFDLIRGKKTTTGAAAWIRVPRHAAYSWDSWRLEMREACIYPRDWPPSAPDPLAPRRLLVPIVRPGTSASVTSSVEGEGRTQ